MNITTVIQFFDPTKQCPEEIKDCASLRKQYFDELSNLNSTQCKECDRVKLRDRYIAIIR